MDDCCQFVEGCPMFAYFNRTAKRVYLDMYCEGDFARCKRRQLRVSGQPVPPDLLPYGGSLSYDVERPRTRTIL